jgi:hypothetical protein
MNESEAAIFGQLAEPEISIGGPNEEDLFGIARESVDASLTLQIL